MQIEETFRDLKSTKFGFGFEHARSRGVLRLSNFVFLTALAQLIACLIGGVAEKNNWQRQYQVSSTSCKRVLSLFFLGCRVIKRNLEDISYALIKDYLIEVQQQGKII